MSRPASSPESAFRRGLRGVLGALLLVFLVPPAVRLSATIRTPGSVSSPALNGLAGSLPTSGGAANAEIPTIVETNYPLPATGAFFVSPTGNDANTGTEAAPFKTVTKAVATARVGSTIVFREGTYREQVPSISKRLTFQPYPREKAWMKGSVVVTNWVADGARWRLDNWTTEFCRTCYDQRAINPAYPLAAWPDMVFVNGRSLTQVDAGSKVTGNTFFVDYAADKMWIGTNPAGATVEASVFPMAINAFTSAAGTVIRGLGFAQYAPYYNAAQNAMVRVNAKSFIIEKNTFAYSAHSGLVMYGAEDSVVRQNTFLYNGGTGFGGFKPHRLLAEGNRFAFANQENFGVGWAVGGVKVATTYGATFKNNIFEGNLSKGFWCDISCWDFKITGNTVRENKDHGIFYELSSKGVIAGNIIVGHPTYGIRISGSNDVKVYNNTLVRNATHLSVHDTSGYNLATSEQGMGITWITTDVVAFNNLMSRGNGSALPFVHVRDQANNPFKPGTKMVSASDNNGYWRASTSTPTMLVEWWESASGALKLNDLPAYRAATGREGRSIMPGPGSTEPFFVSDAGGDYRLRDGSPAIKTGAPLPADVASALGLPAGQPVDMGALQRPATPESPTTTTVPSTTTTTTVTPGATTVVFSDTFNRTDSPTTLGAGWQVRGTGTWGVSGGKAMSSGANQTTAVATCAADGEVSVDVTVGGDVGVVIRGVDTNNYLFVQQSGFIKRSNGVFVRLSNLKSAMGNGTWRVAASGDRITATNATGVVVLDYKLTADEAARYTGTACGMRANQDTTSRFDNFVFTVPSGRAPPNV